MPRMRESAYVYIYSYIYIYIYLYKENTGSPVVSRRPRVTLINRGLGYTVVFGEYSHASEKIYIVLWKEMTVKRNLSQILNDSLLVHDPGGWEVDSADFCLLSPLAAVSQKTGTPPDGSRCCMTSELENYADVCVCKLWPLVCKHFKT